MHRGREWDAVASVRADVAGDEAWLVALPGGELLVEDGAEGLDPAPLVAAVALEPPFRAHAVRRSRGGELWAIAACRLEVVQLHDDPAGAVVVVTWDGRARTVRIDDEPTLSAVPELERLGAARHAAYVVTAERLTRDLWEVTIAAL